MLRDIVTGKDTKVLRRQAKDVKKIDGDVLELVRDMQETLAATDNGIGLAAPQVGESLRLFIIHPHLAAEEAEGHEVYINPEITKASRKTVEEEEGCLSIPGKWDVIARPQKVTVKAQDEYGNSFKVTGKGLLARLFRHEVDHLQGILYLDHIKKD